MKAKFPQYFFNQNDAQSSNLPSLLVRLFLYGGLFVNLLLPFYNYKTNSFGWWDDLTVEDYSYEAKYMGDLSHAQHEYYLEHGKFSDSLEKLQIEIEPRADNYSYRILAPMVPVQTWNQSGESAPNSQSVVIIAQAKYPTFSSYIAMVSAIKDKDTNTVISTICDVGSYTLPSTMPTLAGREIQCPKGTKKITVRLPETSFPPASDHQYRN
jgi:hypothetical protein